ncbi:hypothetical protein [Paenibacillus sp. MMO-177]|uniref:hypothetical protein n=1 Tax=Paenibacillus sp. MMO-177 TaxID=3081289 RepID=UPI00301650EA
METIQLKGIEIVYRQQMKELLFQSAELVLVSDYGSKLWYVDVNGVKDTELLQWFGQSEDIRIELYATATDGRTFNGTAYLHPNEPHLAAAIRGDGELRES